MTTDEMLKVESIVAEMQAEIERLCDVQMYDRNLIKALTTDNERLRAQNAELKEARRNLETRLNAEIRAQ